MPLGGEQFMTSKHGNKGVPLSIPKVIELGEPQNQITQRALSVPARDTTKFPFLRKGLASPHCTHAHTSIHVYHTMAGAIESYFPSPDIRSIRPLKGTRGL